MQNFYEWLDHANLLTRLRLLENFYGLDPQAYNRVFNDELEKVIARTSDPTHLQALEGMRDFNWMGYICAAIRNSGFHDQREIQERSHDIAVKLLLGTLFRGFDERVAGPMDRRFKSSVANAVRNMAEKERNRRRLLPTTSFGQEFQVARHEDDQDDRVIQDFRDLVGNRLGDLGVAILDLRLAGGEIKSLVGSGTDKNVVKKLVRQIKDLAKEFGEGLGDPGFLRDIERAMGRESETIGKRRAAMAGRKAG
jgi:hypothetical protein